MGRVVLLERRYCAGEANTNRVLAYAKGLSELGEDVYIYFLIADKKRTTYYLDLPNVNVVNLWENDGFLSKRIRAVSFVKNYISFILQVKKGDCIFFHGLYHYLLCLVKLCGRRAKIFCESTEHPNVFRRHSSRYNYSLAKVLNKQNALFVISRSLREHYISLGVDKRLIHVINMFVDTGRFENLRRTTTEKYIAYCGAVSYEKDGVNILIESFAKFHIKHREYKLYIIGKGVEPNIIGKLRDLATQLNVDKFIVFTGMVSPTEMPQLLYNASILALSRPNNLQAQNGFPTKLGEYLATGNPVVVTRVGEIPLFIKHRENGFLADPNPDSFAEQLTWVAEHYELSCVVGHRGKKLAYGEFSYYSQAKKVLSIMKGNEDN